MAGDITCSLRSIRNNMLIDRGEHVRLRACLTMICSMLFSLLLLSCCLKDGALVFSWTLQQHRA